MDKNSNSSILRIGDYVTFKNLKTNGILCAEGILKEDLIIEENVKVFDDSLFCIHQQRQYSAARELEEFLSMNKIDVNNIQDPSTEKYYQALKRGAVNETKLNDSYLFKKMGQIVLFGDIIQLYHVKSGKYLKVVPELLARDERENIRVLLDTNGSSYSWLQISPRYKIDRDGDRVLNNTEVYIKVAERANEYIHRSDRDPLPGQEREVNCSLESTSWKLIIFQSSMDSVDKKMLLTSELVYINDPETRCNLTIGVKKLESLEDPQIEDTASETQLNESSLDLNGGDSLTNEEEIIDRHLFHEYGDIILHYNSDNIDTNCLWFLEKNSVISGGPIKLKTDKIKFKHMNTSAYLKSEAIEFLTENDEIDEKLIFTTTYDSTDPDTLFDITELGNPGKVLQNGKALQLSQSGVWVERGDVLDDGNYAIKGGLEKSFALSLIIYRFLDAPSDDDSNNHKKKGTSENDKEPLDSYVGLAARNYLRRYYTMTVIPQSDSVNSLWPTASRGDLEFFQAIIQKLIYFSQGFPISAKNVQLGIDKSDNHFRIQRQNLLREQCIVEVILKLIKKLIPITERIDEIKNMPKKKKTPISESEMAVLDMGQLILGKCFYLLYYIILDNTENQMYVADFMPVLLAHLSSQPLAGKCVTEMLSKNMELQETKIGTREIQIFVEKLRSSKMNSMYLQLLQSCCSCEGDGVDNNQCKVATMLFSDTNDIIIQLNADFSKITSVGWEQPSLYVTTTPVPGSPLRGDILFLKGLPLLSLAWTTNSIDFSPLGLFGKLSVNIEDLFGLQAFGATNSEIEGKDTMMLAKKNQAKKSSNEQKMAVANYFVAEMFLGAEMCMDRNYVAMHLLDQLFPYEVLVAILKMDVNNNLKAAAVRLLMCLHVDRDPQATSKIPCLTRTWSDTEKNDEPQLPYVDHGRRHTFGLIQQIISEHIKDMAGNSWDDLSRHMLKMLRTLVQFNFYGTNERMKDVIGPLIRALDRRNLSSSAYGNSTLRRPSKVLGNTNKSSTNNNEVIGDESLDGATLEDGNMTMIEEEKEEKPKSIWNLFGWFSPKPHEEIGNDNATAVTSFSINKIDSSIPIRYSKAPTYELETMVEAIDILAFAQKVIEDRNISLLLRYFYLWNTGTDKRSPAELFEQTVNDSHELSMDVSDFDDVMIDNLMFEHNSLVQSTLEVLMAHHSMRKTLLDNIKNVQLLASRDRERQFRIVDQMLKQLEQNAETHELWGELENEDHFAVNKQTKDILKELIDICRIRRHVLEFDEDYMADKEIQDLYRNLGCFEICMKVMGLLDSVDPDENGELSEVALNTRDICLLCNTLLYWYFLGNDKNQEQGYNELSLFLDTLDDEINSHLVIQALFKNNEILMRQVPHTHLATLVDKIIKNGKSPHYLSLFAAISHVGERNIVENQFEIVKSLTSPGRLQKVSCFFVPIDNPEYEEKRKLMEPYLNVTKDLSLDDLPPLLAYHLMFLEVLSGCTVGRMNITTVEAKVQSVFNYIDILQSILDPGTIIVCKIRLSKFFFNSFIEVELKIPGLDQSPDIWKLLNTYKSILSTSKEEIENVNKVGWQSPGVSRQKIEYILVCIMVIGGFFTHYYQAAVFQPEDREPHKSSSTKVQFSLTHVDELILYFFTKIKEIHDLDSSILSDETKTMIYETLLVLNKQVSGSNTIVTYIKPPKKQTEALAIDNSKLEVTEEGIEDELELPEDPEKIILNSLKSFIKDLEKDDALQYKAENENVAFISILEKLPFIDEPVHADVRYETLIKKLVSHIRENIKLVNNQKRLDARVTKTSTWIIRAFRTMIENKMGMSIYERDDEGGLEQDEAAAPVVNALNTCGATALCLDLIADGIDEKLQLEAIKLGVGLLFKEGGALEVQGIMNNHLNKTNSELFFKQVRLTLQKLQAWHNWNQVIVLQDGEEPNLPEDILIVRFLQLMCEGHYLPNQDIMREQPNNRVSYNLLDDFVNYLNCLSRIPCRTSTTAAIRLSATILEVIQGPCEGNQSHLTLNTELIETLNRMNRAKLVHDCVEDEEIELKKTCIDIFQGILEGQGEKSVVYERVLSVIHLDIIQMMSNGVFMTVDELDENASANEKKTEEVSEEKAVLQTECVVLLQMLCNFKPSLYDELGISRNIEDIVGSGTAMIEVIWRGDIHRRFFHVPNICQYLAKSSKDALIENVDRSNPENKLIDFLNRSHELYREVKHQQLLTELGVSGIFSRENQNRATWITFFLALIINILILFDYKIESNDPKISPETASAVGALNLIQAIVSGFVLLLFLVVRIPVKYQSLEAAGHSKFYTVLFTASEPMTLYYIWYLVFSILGQVYAYDFLPFLLLDIIVKNSTTRDVLNAVIYPRKQIALGGIVILFLVQIYTFFLFFYFRDQFQEQPFCDTFWGCYKFTLGYGLREGGGVGDILLFTVGKRWILDISFYFIVNTGMLNLIAGVIITTFGQLRENKARKLEDTVGVCFICNIDKQVFDRSSEEPDGFKTHVKIDHNIWNYLYFIFLLWEQDRDDDDGLEQYVRRAIDGNEIIWFPLNKAIRLNQAATKEESLLNDLKKKITDTESNINGKLDKFQTDINIVLEQLNQTLKQDHSNLRSDTASRGGRTTRPGTVFGQNENKNSEKLEILKQNAAIQLKKIMFLQIMEVALMKVIPSNVENLICNVVLGNNVLTFTSLGRIGKRAPFEIIEPKKLVDPLETNDTREIQFQILYTNPENNELITVANASVSIEELAMSEGNRFDIFFDAEDMENAGKVSIISTIIKQKLGPDTSRVAGLPPQQKSIYF